MSSIFLARFGYFLKDFYLYLILISLSSLSLIFVSYKIYKAKISKTPKKFFLALVFTIFISILTFSVWEAYFRYIYDESDGLGFLKVNSKWQARHVIYNNYFFRDRNFDLNKREGVTRIGVLGDSIAFGGGIENLQDRFSNLLESKLRSLNDNTEVYNLGKSGYDAEAEIQEYEKVKSLNFDIVIWEYFLNDIQPYEKSTGTPIIIKNSQQTKIVQFFSEKSYLFDFIYWKLSARHQTTFKELKDADLAQYQNQPVLTEHKKTIATFIANLKKDGKKVIVIIFPFVHLLGPGYPARDIHQIMSGFFKEQEVAVIDLLDNLKDQEPKNLIAGRFDPHPNEFVHKLAADKLFEKMGPLLK